MERLGHLIDEAIKMDHWKPLFLLRRGSNLSHLFFVNNLMLFFEASVQQASMISSILESFCFFFSGQKINFSKSLVCFSPSTPSIIIDQICARLGFFTMDNLGSYLGLPLLHDRVRVNSFDFIVGKV